MPSSAEADLAFAPIAEVARRLRAGSLTIPSLTAMMLGRIERLNPALNCYITVLREPALAQAEVLQRLLDGGTDLGPLHGIPVAIKGQYRDGRHPHHHRLPPLCRLDPRQGRNGRRPAEGGPAPSS